MKTEVSDVDFSYSALLCLARWNNTPDIRIEVGVSPFCVRQFCRLVWQGRIHKPTGFTFLGDHHGDRQSTEGIARIEESFTRRHRKANRTFAMLHLSR